MNKFPKRVLFISMLLIVNILMLASCKSKDIYDDENLDYTIDINNENAKVLSIKDVENNSDDSDNELKLSKVIKNISDISIYNILITYEEINKRMLELIEEVGELAAAIKKMSKSKKVF